MMGQSIARRQLAAAKMAVLWGLLIPLGVQASEPVDNDNVVAMDRLAIEHNEAIQAFDRRAASAQYEAEFEAGRWPEPTLEYMLDISAPWASHLTTGHMVQLMQPIPRGGARDARAAPARAAVEVERSEKRTEIMDMLRDLRLDLVALARLNARISLLHEEIELIDDALSVLEEVAPVGRGDHGDFFQLELARETALDDVAQLRAARAARKSNMASRIGVETQILESREFSSEILEEWLIELPDTAQIVAEARVHEPGLASLDARAAVAQSRIELVDQRQRPWPRLMAGYSNRPPMWEMEGSRHQVFQVGVSIALPIFGSQYDAEASKWQSARQAVEEERGQHSTELRGEIEALMAEWSTDRERLRRHERELAPLAGDLSRRVLIGMELGERSAAEYLLAVRQEVELEGRIIEIRAALLKRLMNLQRLTGGTIGANEPWRYSVITGGQQ